MAMKFANDTEQATIEVFLIALKALGKEAQRELLFKLLEDEDLREDVEAAILWEERKDEPHRSFREFVAELEAEEE